MSPPRHQLMPVTDLRPAEYNPRRISEESMAGLSVSIERFGLVQPINWNQRTNRVVGGHRRLKALAARGVEQTEVIVVDLPESEEKALNVALNSPAIAGEFVPEDLDVLLTEIRQSVPELFDALLLEELASNAFREALGLNGGQTDEDAVPEPGDAAVSERGKVYQLGLLRAEQRDGRLVGPQGEPPVHGPPHREARRSRGPRDPVLLAARGAGDRPLRGGRARR